MKRWIGHGALGLGFVVIATAQADSLRVISNPHGQVSSVAVEYGDLDLSRRAGAQSLLNRLSAATRRVCDVDDNWKDLSRQELMSHCMRDTMDRAVASVPSQSVKRLYAEQTEGPAVY